MVNPQKIQHLLPCWLLFQHKLVVVHSRSLVGLVLNGIQLLLVEKNGKRYSLKLKFDDIFTYQISSLFFLSWYIFVILLEITNPCCSLLSYVLFWRLYHFGRALFPRINSILYFIIFNFKLLFLGDWKFRFISYIIVMLVLFFENVLLNNRFNSFGTV